MLKAKLLLVLIVSIFIVGCSKPYYISQELTPNIKRPSFILDKRTGEYNKHDAFLGGYTSYKMGVGTDNIFPNPIFVLDEYLENNLAPSLKGKIVLKKYRVIYHYASKAYKNGHNQEYKDTYACEVEVALGKQTITARESTNFIPGNVIYTSKTDKEKSIKALSECVDKTNAKIASEISQEINI